METGRTRLTVILLLGLMFFGLPLFILPVVLVRMADSFNLTRDQMGPIYLGFFLSWVVTPPLCAPLSNLLGKRNFLMIGSLVAIGGLVLMGFAKDITTAGIADFLMGYGGMSFQIIGISALYDFFPQSRASAVALSQTVGIVFALAIPPLAGHLVDIGVEWRYLFLASAVMPFVLLALVSTLRFPPKAAEQTNFRAVASLFKMPFFLLMGFAMLVYGIIEQGIPTWLPSYMQKDLGQSGFWAALPLSLYNFSMPAGRLLAGGAKIADRVPYFVSIIFSTLLGMAAIALGVATTNPYVTGISLGMVGMLICLIWPAILAAAVDTTGKDSTTVMGGIIFFGGTGALLGSFFMGSLSKAFDSMRLALATLEIPGFLLLVIFLAVYVGSRRRAKGR